MSMTKADGETAEELEDPAADFFPHVHPATPEYVGAVSAIERESCSKWDDDLSDRCRAKATHSVIIYDGRSFESIAVCDECGRPEDVDHELDREWSGEIRR